ncbi:hypothetical protein A3Q56_03135 [Intoshia linei]|uniref:Uncharacterized protein n=1 Tax=Intoshia linei TaxID=1819745 RepID=A0A177B4A6_9BILA|nr:hypothetical protein A3Q56_03135 [Intoshia linei]
MTNIVGELSNRKTAILDEISSSGLQGICWKCLCSYLGNTVNVKIGEENFIEIFNFLITQKFEFYESFEHHCYAVTNKYDIEETIINDDKHFISNKGDFKFKISSLDREDHRGTCKDYKSRNRIKMKTSLNFNKFLKSLDEKKSRVIIVSSQENRSQLLFNHVYFQRFDIKVYALMERIAASKQFGISIKYGATYYKMAQHYFYFGSTLRKCIRRQYRQNRIWYINNVNKPSYVYLLKFYNLKAINTSLDSNGT